MALVTVVEVVEGERPSIIFYGEFPTLDDATVALLEFEEEHVQQDWLAEVAYKVGFYREQTGYQFSMVDSGREDVTTYVYTVTQ